MGLIPLTLAPVKKKKLLIKHSSWPTPESVARILIVRPAYELTERLKERQSLEKTHTRRTLPKIKN